MTQGIRIGGTTLGQGLQRVIATGVTGTSAGSVTVANFDSSGKSYIISNEAGLGVRSGGTSTVNSITALFSFNNSSKVLSWTFPSVNVNPAFSSAVGIGTPTNVSTAYIVIQEGGASPGNRFGAEVNNPDGSLNVDDRFPVLAVVYENTITTAYSRPQGSGTPITYAGSSAYALNQGAYTQFFAGVPFFAYPSSQMPFPNVDFNVNTFVPFFGPQQSGLTTSQSVSQGFQIAHSGANINPPYNVAGTFSIKNVSVAVHNLGRLTTPNQGVAFFNSSGQGVWNSSVKTMRILAHHTESNILNLNVNSYVDITHEATSAPYFYINSTYARLNKIVRVSQFEINVAAPSLVRINSTTTRLFWSQYLVNRVNNAYRPGAFWNAAAQTNVASTTTPIQIDCIIGEILDPTT